MHSKNLTGALTAPEFEVLTDKLNLIACALLFCDDAVAKQVGLAAVEECRDIIGQAVQVGSVWN